MKNRVIILRGLPGSGKSTLSNKIIQNKKCDSVICSADHFFYNGKEMTPENYKYDQNLVGAAHNYCLDKFLISIENGIPLIIVDNTNTKISDFKAYVELAIKNNYLYEIHSIFGITPEKSFERNTHNVPLEVCKKMFNRFNKINHILINKQMISISEIEHNYSEIENEFNKKNKEESRAIL
jgi:predicted kinase